MKKIISLFMLCSILLKEHTAREKKDNSDTKFDFPLSSKVTVIPSSAMCFVYKKGQLMQKTSKM